MATQQEVLKSFMATLDTTTLKGTEALDAAIQACSNFNSLQDFKDKIVSDCKSVGDSETFLRDYCGIIIGNADTGAITGSDAENGTVKTAKSVVPESGDLENFTGDEFTVDGLTVKLGKGGGTGTVKARTFSNLSTQEKYIWQSLYTYWIKSALDLIGESYGENFSFNEKSSATSKTLYVIFDNSNNGVLASTWGGPDYAQKSTNDIELHINLYFYKSATGEDGIPNSNQNYLDRIISHELTHAVMRSNTDYYDYLPKWLKEGMAELTHGIDDKRTSDLRTLAGNSSLLQKVFSGTSVSGVSAPSYSGGYLILRYLAKQAADTYTKIFNGTDANDQLETHNNSVTLSGGKGNDSLGNGFYTSASYSLQGGDNVSLDGGAGNDSLMNCYGNFVTLSGGAGDDKIINRNGANVLINYADGDGNDSIVGFNETSTLSISGGVSETTKSGSDLIVTVGDGKITLTGATGLKTLNIVDRDTKFLALDDTSAASVTVDAKVETIDASSRTTAIRIIGNALDNSILGGSGKDSLYGKDGDDYISGGAGNDKLSGYTGNDSLSGGAGNDSLHGGTGNDTLDGGAGNDTLIGGDGADLFIYTAGKDLIRDFSASDTLQIGDGTDTYLKTTSSDDLIFTVGNGLVTLKGAATLSTLNIIGEEGSATLTYDDSSPTKVTLASGIEFADASARTTAIKIVGNALDNSIAGGSGKDSLYGNTGDDYLIGNAGNDKLYGQNGDDTLWGDIGNDTLTGGAGSDVFIYTAGNDVIADYAAGDKISIGAAIAKSSVKGSDATFTIGSNTLTVKNGKGAEIVFIDADSNERTIIGGAFVATNSTSTKNTLASWREVGDATGRTTAIKIVGNALDNSIFGGTGKDSLYGNTGNDYLAGNTGNDKLYGQAGDDTLWGGIGNDTLTGGAGADTFIYTAGKDVIADFADDDLLQISETFSGTYNESANTIAFKVGSTANAITLKNFTATTFNINGDAWRINGKQLVK